MPRVGKQFDQARRLCLERAALMGDQVGREPTERAVALREHGQANLHQITPDKTHGWLGFTARVPA